MAKVKRRPQTPAWIPSATLHVREVGIGTVCYYATKLRRRDRERTAEADRCNVCGRTLVGTTCNAAGAPITVKAQGHRAADERDAGRVSALEAALGTTGGQDLDAFLLPHEEWENAQAIAAGQPPPHTPRASKPKNAPEGRRDVARSRVAGLLGGRRPRG